MGQYLKIPPRVMFLTQIWGTLLGAVVNYGECHMGYLVCQLKDTEYVTVVMVSVVDAQREILLDPTGTNIWR